MIAAFFKLSAIRFEIGFSSSTTMMFTIIVLLIVLLIFLIVFVCCPKPFLFYEFFASYLHHIFIIFYKLISIKRAKTNHLCLSLPFFFIILSSIPCPIHTEYSSHLYQLHNLPYSVHSSQRLYTHVRYI